METFMGIQSIVYICKNKDVLKVGVSVERPGNFSSKLGQF